ncbi:MAG: SDR family NAD(P)-dependent oxidoreductase [bacterium]
MKKYLITGGTGFIGSNIVRELVNQKKEVILLVEKNPDFWRIKDLLDLVSIFEVDLTNFEQVQEIISKIKPQIIFHLAAVGVNPDFDNLNLLFDVNFFGTVNLLRACQNVVFDCFINTGTSSEYGIKKTAMNEDDILEPMVDYAISKASSTMFCLKEAKTKKLPIYTVRPFNVYGDFEHPHRLIPSLMINYLKNNPINLSNPNFVRDFIYVKDVVNFYLTLSEQKPDEYLFNIGTGIQTPLKSVVKIFESIINEKLNVNWGMSAPRPWEVDCWYADVNMAKNILNWQAEFDLEKGLEESFKWFKKNLSLYNG